MKLFFRNLRDWFPLLFPYGLAVWLLKHTGFRFYCAYLVPFLGPFTWVFLPFGDKISEKTVYELCGWNLLPFVFFLLRFRHRPRIVCVLWSLWFLACLSCFAVWQYEYKANDAYPANPHKNKLICWEYMPPHEPSFSPPLQSVPPATVSVKSVFPKATSVSEAAPVVVSTAIAAVCGADPATSDRYEARNDALRAIARNRNLPTSEVTALQEWLASTNDTLRVERVAALKNDVMNLLRNQEPPPPGLAGTLVAMFESEAHPPAVLDYCIQHLGAVQGDIADESMRRRIRATLVKAANRTKLPYAGTALYALAEDGSATPAQEAELRRLTLALCSPDANAVARIAAIQLAGQRGYAEALPLLRATLSSARRDAVTDVVCIGSLGLLGTADDIPLLRRFAALGPRYAPAAETAIKRIEERGSVDGNQN